MAEKLAQKREGRSAGVKRGKVKKSEPFTTFTGGQGRESIGQP